MSSVRFSRHLLKTSRSKGKKVAALLFLALFILGVVLCGYPSFADLPSFEKVLGTWSSSNASESPPVTEYSSFLCPRVNKNYTCPTSRQTLPWKVTVLQPSSIRNCPEYFRWIHEDLRPWKSTGITRAMVERARRTAHFRLLVVKGKLYMESYGIPFQTRDIFTWWGFIQLMRRYPGQIRDLDLMFDCGDGPVVRAADYFPFPNKEDLPPPLFKYCKDDQTLDILFPDWSFWGWTEINIKPWAKLKEEMEEGNKRTQWIDREPYAYWKGNPTVAGIRAELMKCNLSPEHDWNARLYVQDWGVEAAKSFKSSNLADQCINRYKIYIEGWAWSVSQKYILACDSPTLSITTRFQEFFTRALEPLKHYWPINRETMCKSIKFAVDWGNSNKVKAQAIGRNGSKFIMEDLKMDYVYDYMFHLLNEYAKLMRYKPVVPPNARELCLDFMTCSLDGREKQFLIDSMVDVSQVSIPCSLPSPYTHEEMKLITKRREKALKLVQKWEQSNRASILK